jgi:hypothetical protein
MKTGFGLLILVALTFAAGCAPVAWQKSGATRADLIDAMGVCRPAGTAMRLETQDWISGSPTLILPSAEFDHQGFGACMSERGYVAGY